MNQSRSTGVENAVVLARNLGVACDQPVVLGENSHLVVHLAPAPVVAHVTSSVALARPDVLPGLDRELAVARFLKQQGAPVAAPSGEVDPGPHVFDGYAITFWDHVAHDPSRAVRLNEAVPMLRELHRALDGYPGELPYLTPVVEKIPRWLRYLQANRGLLAMDMMMLREAHWRLAETLSMPQGRSQALHGNAHIRHLLSTPAGLLWNGFEDVCRGPLAWDVVSLGWGAQPESPPTGVETALKAYDGSGKGWSRETLLPYIDARELQSVVWLQVLATRFPERRQKADLLLEAWRRKA
jgi:Phosphotransferase enzyme family